MEAKLTISEDKPFNCSYCCKMFQCSSALVQHIRTHTGEKPYKCNECGLGFAARSNRNSHRKIHKTKRKESCTWPECGKVFKTPVGLKVHQLIHYGTCKYPCTREGCDRVYRRPCDLGRHVRNTHDLEYCCTYCNKRFGTAANLCTHTTIHTGEKLFLCTHPNCTSRYATKSGLDEHIKNRHGSTKWIYMCTVPGCNKIFNYETALKKHTKTHREGRPKVECNICGKMYLKQGIIRHSKLHNSERELKHACTYCGKKYGSATELARHIRIHTGEKPYRCPSCPRKFICSSGLGSHIITTHQVQKAHACQQCGQRYKTRAGLKSHANIHKTPAERPEFPCSFPECGKKLSSKSSLTTHAVTHLSETERNYLCPFCDKTFGDGNRFKAHLRVHTREKPKKCKKVRKQFVKSN